ncbi:YgjP-like metallopeptidase domain-containing protein [Nonomuraea sp. NPDC049400]|uniref:YgjP-like metallopeptidase domain-containing protein n=1 Tax=Nonomuraea sp. NPDC049400 TaxID=3364352 RepID=UPI0037932919
MPTPSRSSACPNTGRSTVIPDATAIDVALLESALLTVSARWTWHIRINPRRNTIGLTVERDASVTVTAPPDSSLDHIVETARSRVLWLAKNVRLARETAPDRPVKELVGGENFPWLGRHHRLRLVDDDGPAVHLEDNPSGWLRLQRRHARDARSLIAWYSQRLSDHLTETSTIWHPRFGLHQPVTFRVDDLGEEQSAVRLGSKPAVTVHWAAAQLRVPHVTYLMVRELCHVQAGRRLGKKEHIRLLNLHMPGWSDHHQAMVQEWRRVWIGAVRTHRPPEPTSDVGIFCRLCHHGVAAADARRISMAEPGTNPWCCPTCWDERLA